MSKKNVAIVLLIAFVVLFVYSQTLKSKYRLFKERINSSNEFVHEFSVKTGSSYIISIWGCDEESGLQKWADLDFSYKIESESKVIKEGTITATASEEQGGVRRATNGKDIDFIAKGNKVSVWCEITEGDYVDVEIYEDLPNSLYWFPVISVIGFIVSIFYFFKARVD